VVPLVDLTADAPAEDTPSAPAVPARPTNYKRSAFHVLSGAFALSLLVLLPARGWVIAASACFAVFAWTCEIARRVSPAVNARLMRLFAPVAHPHEAYKVNSSTWYVTALILMAAFAPVRAAEIGVIVLAVADPFAGLIGRRFGRTRIRAGRSLEGSLAFVAAGALVAGVWLYAARGVALPAAAILAGAAALAGAVAEIVTLRLDDNFTIPVAATTAATIALALV
jgi:dolichol kinase